jgi:hypothetical protein
MKSAATAVSIIALAALLTGCDGPLTTGAPTGVISVSIVPDGGALNVDPTATVSATFGHSMPASMMEFMVIHEGGLFGPSVTGRWEWSADGLRCHFVPDQPLRSGQQYAIHLGGAMVDLHGHEMDFQHLERHMGGHWVTEDMMGSGSTHGQGAGHGWRHHSGSFGMQFLFTTR